MAVNIENIKNEFMGSNYRNYRTLLLRISDHFTEGNLEKLKFLCSDDIEEGELEEIKSPLKLFKALERRKMIAVDDLSFLHLETRVNNLKK